MRHLFCLSLHRSGLPLCVLIFSLHLPLTARATVVLGTVVDGSTNEPLGYVSIKAQKPYRDAQISGTVNISTTTDSTGCFTIRTVGTGGGGRLTMEFNCPGYHTLRHSCVVATDEYGDTVRLDTLRMRPSETLLRTAVVRAHARRFVMRGDTVVFNPAAFNVPEGGRIDDLISQLPGVSMSSNGALTWMGRPLRVLINGEDYLNGQTQMLTGVLPAEMVDRIRVYDRGSRYRERTGNHDGVEDHVLDLEIAPRWFEKWYGEASAAYQPSSGYEAETQAFRLSDHNPWMVYANANNRNHRKKRSPNGRTFHELGGDGKAQTLALDYEHRADTTASENSGQRLRRRYGFSASLGHDDSRAKSHTTREIWGAGSAPATSVTLTDNHRYSHALRPEVGGKWQWDFDAERSLSLAASLAYTRSDDNSETRQTIGTRPADGQPSDLDVTTRSRNTHTATGKQATTTFYTDYYQFLPHGSFGLSLNANYNDTRRDTHTRRAIDYLHEGRSDNLHQRSEWNALGGALSLGANFGHNFTKHFNINANYTLNFRADHSDNALGTQAASPADAFTPDPSNTYRSRRTETENALSLNSTLRLRTVTLRPALRLPLLHERLSYRRGTLDTTATRTALLPAPSIELRWKANKQTQWRTSVAYTSQMPELLSTLRYEDTTDPLNITLGNPALCRSHTLRADVGFEGNFPRPQLTLNASLKASRHIRPVVGVLRQDTNSGAYTSWQTNARSGHSLTAALEATKSFGPYWMAKLNASATRDVRYGFLTAYDATATPPQNRQRYFRFNAAPSLSLDYEWLHARLYSDLSLTRSHGHATTADVRLTDLRLGTELRANIGKWELTSNFYDRLRRGYALQSLNGHRLMWYASASRRILRGGRGRLKIEADDILNRATYSSVDVTPDGRTESWQLHPHHFVLVTFTYNFDAVGGKRNAF
ncbi:MAG: TonB-dependent receptor [Bacteroidaceae bacterium]|nr:TonB-dependent receptor [Bacteroidaceae bacterium]